MITKQIQTVLPRSEWDKVAIKENDEPMVQLIETERLKLGSGFKDYCPSFFVRKTIKEKLERAAERLPLGLDLLVVEGYRSSESQQHEWNTFFAKVKNEMNHLSDEEITKIVQCFVARPAPLANHRCGGAVDVVLVYSNGQLVDMGTPYISQCTSLESKKKFPMLSPLITAQQKSYREFLMSAMEQEFFVWYPAEWWHFCFGDRMWAVYSGQETAYYGPVELD